MKCSTPKCTRKPEEGKKQCSVCLASKRKYRIANHTAILVGEKEYKRRIRRAALAKLGNKCIHCGFEDWRALQIDHIEGGGRKECREIGSDGIQRKVIAMEHPETEYQCLCANCNWIKRYENNENGL